MNMLSRELLLELIQAIGEFLGVTRYPHDYTSLSVHSDL